MNKLRLNYLLDMNLIQAWCGNPITWEAEVGESGVQGHPEVLREHLVSTKKHWIQFLELLNSNGINKTLLLKSIMKI